MSNKNTIPLGGAVPSRRAFISNCAAFASLPILASLPPNAFAAGADDRIKVGLIGAGGRGTGAAQDALNADKAVHITAVGDVFEDVVKGKHVRDRLTQRQNSPRSKVAPENLFFGFDAYKRVIDSGVDYVILAAPPHFRPIHAEYAIEKGVNVFAEKPGAVDPVGCRKLFAVAELATKKNLSIAAGTQRRHDPRYIETIRRIRAGELGDLVGGQAYWVGDSTASFWKHKQNPAWSEMEYNLRSWYGFQWLCGDHIVEQHVHNLDIINWAFGGPPVKAFGMGGRQNRVWGDIWDHFAVEFEYANGARVQSFCRQADNTSHRVSERIAGTKGNADVGGGIFRGLDNKQFWKYSGPRANPYVEEHKNLIAAIRSGKPLNEGKTLAEATLTGVLGRLSAYSGKEISYKWILEASQTDLSPSAYDFGAKPPKPGIAVPGKTSPV